MPSAGTTDAISSATANAVRDAVRDVHLSTMHASSQEPVVPLPLRSTTSVSEGGDSVRVSLPVYGIVRVLVTHGEVD